ncbi:hypothetical protein [Maritimibacter alkaliphilus]|uniref:hypothetical protein n=1 Tax=Maritimibacter alkaliphilus TaxID=404236 RepID=UPI001C965B41|nr:hypothetical protein [Maritimibacter alkaliphilus]MBY6090224.1 hypothetical protein [Maritimibacter alkaliphilus]
MSFIRPEARAALNRWREVAIGLAVAALGLWWALTTFGVLKWVGVVLVLAGLGFAAAGVQRARFRSARQGPGVVQVDEGQIAYFGPLTGGIVALSELDRLALTGQGPSAHWVLSQPGAEDLHIPLGAEGAEALFDVFAALPGLPTRELLAKMRAHDATAGATPGQGSSQGASSGSSRAGLTLVQGGAASGGPAKGDVIWEKPLRRLH